MATNFGSTLGMGQIMFEGDYLQSDDGLSMVRLEGDGNVCLYWCAKVPYGLGPWFLVWQSGNSDRGPHYLVMQTDGNLVCYAGIPSDPGPVKWQTGAAGVGPNYYAIVQTDSNFCVYPNAQGYATWCSGCARHAAGVIAVTAICTDNPPCVLSSVAPSSGPTDACTIQEAHIWTDNRQKFFKTDVVVNNRPYGMLLQNVANGMLLSGQPVQYANVRFTDRISNDSIIITVDPGEDPPPLPPGWVVVGLRPVSGWDFHFNVPGDGPYKAGSGVIMYPWARPVSYNELWMFNTVGVAEAVGV